MKTIINGKPCVVELIDEVERIKGYWGEWNCEVHFQDGSMIEGSIQTDKHMVAPESFIPY